MYLWLRLVLEDLFDLLQDTICKLGQDPDRFKVLQELFTA